MKEDYLLNADSYSDEELEILRKLFEYPVWNETECHKEGCPYCKFGHLCRDFYRIRNKLRILVAIRKSIKERNAKC